MSAITKTAPGPRGNLLFGIMRDLQQDRLKFVVDTAIKYGDVVRYRVAYVTIYQINHPDGIERVLQDNYRNYTKGYEVVPSIELILGHGLLTNEGDTWLKQRRLMQPVFHHHNVESFGQLMVDRTDALLDEWERHAQRGEPVDVAAEMSKLTLGIVNQALFSADVSDKAHVVSRALAVLLQDVILRFDLPFYPAPNIPTPHNRQVLRALNELNSIIYGIINARRQNPEKKGDLLDLLMHARDPETGESMSDRQLHDEVVTLFLAGHETTAVTLTWAWYLLAQHPEVEARMHAELERALGERRPTVADLPNMPYTRQVLDETLRLYPPAWIINRRAIQPDEICGYTIPAGAILAISPYVLHHHPAYWEDPERFDPDRMAPECEVETHHRFSYFPFSRGPRQCIGKGFALIEAHLLLARMAQRYRVRLASQQPALQPLLTLRPRDGLPVTLEARYPEVMR